VVFQGLVKGKRGKGEGLVVFLLRRPDGALEHEMEHRGAAAINPTKGTFRIRTAPPLKHQRPRHAVLQDGVLLVNGFILMERRATASNLMILASSPGLLAAPRRKRHVIEVMCVNHAECLIAMS
jgi:hypothetical protein